ncbi:hypothetical protein BDZ91DRAFT_708361 [Kalaharituber pfeilii]|nr:hypothetical protein BDZ91DRAFT_708361 [Kalaharituber pfeilii]
MVSTESPVASTPLPTPPAASVTIIRENGKNWKSVKKAFRPKAGPGKSWDKRTRERKNMEAIKAKEKELKDEKEAARQRQVQALKEKREKKAEKERYEKLALKMHAKRVQRLKRREKRNKALKER